MALSPRLLSGLGAASEEGFEQLQQKVTRLAEQLQLEVARLAEQLAESRSNAAALEVRLREEIAQARSETQGLRQQLHTLAERIDERTHQDLARVADLEALHERCEEREGVVEELRLKIAGLAEQWRWDSENLRKGLTAIAEWARQPA